MCLNLDCMLILCIIRYWPCKSRPFASDNRSDRHRVITVTYQGFRQTGANFRSVLPEPPQSGNQMKWKHPIATRCRPYVNDQMTIKVTDGNRPQAKMTDDKYTFDRTGLGVEQAGYRHRLVWKGGRLQNMSWYKQHKHAIAMGARHIVQTNSSIAVPWSSCESSTKQLSQWWNALITW